MSDELDRREPDGKIEKTTTRRDFLVELKGVVLPSLAALGLGALLQGCDGGGGGCNDCASDCSSGCFTGCKGQCKGGCLGSCNGDCEGGCTGSCTGSCRGGCSGSSWTPW